MVARTGDYADRAGQYTLAPEPIEVAGWEARHDDERYVASWLGGLASSDRLRVLNLLLLEQRVRGGASPGRTRFLLGGLRRYLFRR